MSREQAQSILKTIEGRGYRAYLVGGCVRDLLLGREPEDWDIASAARPEQIMEIFGAAAFPTGLKHGTVTVKAADGAYEITTFRTDGSYSDGRHPDAVKFAKTIDEDLARRDLTINAMALDSAGNIVDPFDGAGDLKRRVVRCVGDARERFREDALRILRAMRFASVLGFSVEEATSLAIHSQAELLERIAAERILVEMNKLLCGQRCKEVLLDYSDVLGIFIPELLPCVGFSQQNVHHCYDIYTHTAYAVDAIRPEPILRWTMLLHDIGKVAIGNKILEKPGRLTDDEFAVMKHHAAYTYSILSEIDDFEEICDWAAFHHERLDGTGYPFGKTAAELNTQERIMACVDIYQALTESRPYKQGMPHEKAYGILNDMVEKGWLDGEIASQVDACFDQKMTDIIHEEKQLGE